ncbi:MAG TPA: response regulator [Candidatus Omnitrophota bacterium]|nr:response regulator [Candidatus Omnitrophota bacterium]
MAQKRIFHVDDDATILKIVKKRLEGAGYHVESLKNDIEEVVQKAVREKPDLIVLDLYMGNEKDGVGLCQRLTSGPETKDIPVVFFTNGKLADIVARCEKAGAITVILKPFINELLDTAKAIFDGTWSKDK